MLPLGWLLFIVLGCVVHQALRETAIGLGDPMLVDLLCTALFLSLSVSWTFFWTRWLLRS